MTVHSNLWLRPCTSRKRPPLLGDQFSKIPRVFKSYDYIWNFSQVSDHLLKVAVTIFRAESLKFSIAFLNLS